MMRRHLVLMLVLSTGACAAIVHAQTDNTSSKATKEFRISLLGDGSLRKIAGDPFRSSNGEEADGASSSAATGFQLDWPNSKLTIQYRVLSTNDTVISSVQGIGDFILVPQNGTSLQVGSVEYHYLFNKDSDTSRNYASNGANAYLHFTSGTWSSRDNGNLPPVGAIILSPGIGYRWSLDASLDAERGNTFQGFLSVDLGARIIAGHVESYDAFRRDYLKTDALIFPGLIVNFAGTLNGVGGFLNFTIFDDVTTSRNLIGLSGFNIIAGIKIREDVIQFGN